MMRTEAHWHETYTAIAHSEAVRIAFQLREVARQLGYDPRSVKVLSKKQIIDQGYGRATSLISWQEGPDTWADDIRPFLACGVCTSAEDRKLVFYDI